MEDFKKVLKSVVLCSPTRFQAGQLDDAFKSYVGTNIPYEEFGFRSLLDFLHSGKLSDILVVKERNLFAPVQSKLPCATTKWPRKRKKKSKNKKQVQNTVREKANMNSQRPEPSRFDSNTSNPISTNINVDHLKEKISTMERRINMLEHLHEEKSKYKIGDSKIQELRLPKTVIILEKNGHRFGVAPPKPGQDASGMAVRMDKTAFLNKGERPKTNIRNHPNIQDRLRHFPGKKLENVSDDSSSLRRTAIATECLLDTPVPPSIPDVAEEFKNTKNQSNSGKKLEKHPMRSSDTRISSIPTVNLIDLGDESTSMGRKILPAISPVGTRFQQNSVFPPMVAPPLKPLPYLEVVRLIRELQISCKH